jgi:Ras-related protein Rab-8A
MTSKPSIVRLLTLGDSGAGKSSLLLRYTQNEFTIEYMPTIGIDFRLKTIDVKGKTIKVQVWDTAGQERFRTITHNYYRGAHGIALVYDVTNEASFQNIRKWIQDVHTYAEQSVNLVLIGNKCDLVNKKVVETSRGQALADEYDIRFFETSAKTDTNVEDAFSSLVEAVVDRMFSSNTQQSSDHNGPNGKVNPAESSATEKKKCCN